MASAADLQTATRPHLLRELGVSQACAVVVGTIIGSGIFLVPAEMMQAVGSAKVLYLVWIVGGLLSFFGALTYAELGAMKPQAGGEYVYVRDAYGPLAGFLYAWTTFLISKPASIATITTGLVRILGTFAVFSFFDSHVVGPIKYGQLVAVAAAVLISFLNYIGIKKAGEFQLIFTLLKIAIVLGIVFVGFTYVGGSWMHFAETYAGAKGGITGFMAALVAALWAYDGWNNLNMVSEEIREPERNIPIALIVGVATVGALYMLVNAAVQFVLPANAVAASPRVASDAIGIVLGSAGAAIVSAGMALSMLVTLNGTTMSGARVPFAVARDRYFFSALAEVHPRFHTPAMAILAQAVIAALFALTGQYRSLYQKVIFSEFLFYALCTAGVFVLRRKRPDLPRPYRTWGYPLVPALFVALSVAVLLNLFYHERQDSMWGVVLVATGVPAYLLWKVWKRRSRVRDMKVEG